MRTHRKSTSSYKSKCGYTCMICGEPANIVHHIVPLSDGGLDHPNNWIILCKKCHTKGKLHKNADELELPLAIKKHYFESSLKIEKYPQAFIIGPQRTINLIHSRIHDQQQKPIENKPEASTRITGICKQCGKPFSGRINSIYCSSSCRYAHHNQIRKNKEIFIDDLILNHFKNIGLKTNENGWKLRLKFANYLKGLIESNKLKNQEQYILKEIDNICFKSLELHGYEVKKKKGE